LALTGRENLFALNHGMVMASESEFFGFKSTQVASVFVSSIEGRRPFGQQDLKRMHRIANLLWIIEKN
jgi:hypothetical protein